MPRRPTSVSVVITTYRSPEPLRLVLRALARQTRPADEVIVAEDGAWDVNRELVDGFRAGWPGVLTHTTQADAGCRLNASRNRGLQAATGEYLILIDGDMVGQPRFVADHLAFARPGRFAQARRVRLTAALTERLYAEERIDIGWWERGVERRHYAIRSPLLARWASKTDRSTKHTRGANMAFWRDDLLAINGFDMDYQGWGRNDIDTAARLLHHGLGRTYIRQAAIAFHLFHPGLSKDQVPDNQERYEHTLATGKVRCDNGLAQIDEQP